MESSIDKSQNIDEDDRQSLTIQQEIDIIRSASEAVPIIPKSPHYEYLDADKNFLKHKLKLDNTNNIRRKKMVFRLLKECLTILDGKDDLEEGVSQ